MAQIGSPASTLIDPTQRRFRGSTKIAEYEVMPEKLGEGTFGVVSKAVSKRTGNLVALKKILMHNEKDGFPITALREVKLLKMLSHPNILRLEEMAVERQQGGSRAICKSGKKRATLYMVTPYMDHDLSGMLTNPDIRFSEAQIKCYMQQLLEGLRYLHDSHILHRDMKAANILISNKGILQIADFGLARHYSGTRPQPGKGNGEADREYTSLVVTRWYRPPELLLTFKWYTPAIDLWGVGCVFGEMYERKPILEGRTDLDQCHRIFQLVGSPTEESMPGWSELPGCEGHKDFEAQKGDIDKRFASRMSPEGLNLLKQLLLLDYRKRINAIDALQHEFFKTKPYPARPEDLPKYEDSHELDARRRGHEKQRALPPAPAGGTVGMGPDDWDSTGAMGGTYSNGYGFADRLPRGGYGRERGPPGGPPPRGYDDRRGGRPPPVQAPPTREPGWRQEQRGRAPPLPSNSHHLPPRPADLPPRPDAPGRGPTAAPPGAGAPAGAGAGGGRRGPDVDTYIPNYDDRRPPPPRHYDGSRRNSKENAYRDPDAPPPPRGYRDADVPPQRYRDMDAPYRDRDRGGYGDQRRTRSRSPDRDRAQRESDARRERLQNRERDMYRR
ncbi:hypothetical protein BAUCODRAFT_463451 [Baudoinia panamericana UAMH 10762]|uniref:Protein kinase domain-containing protein n=1 Tax=Baudoinia panamericana (strain UAMH 10762) TaxID=717646 RepID=M2LT67_BAUPA|nr:uncharacterized protein BAUCODRAFT_463451 [Baudoinia panamericana UAMH 10762]EMC97712.1 hypothetical protein BAUCODRAFT_463451 [Baudoinia panamericana UAMH 10762]